MENIARARKNDYYLIVAIGLLIIFGLIVLRSIAAFLFPIYFVYVAIAILAFIIFLQIDFEVISIFSKYFYIGSIIFLILPLLIGQVTRGAIRWVPIGSLTIQPAEIVRPFLFIFFANYLTETALDLKRFLKAIVLFAIPFYLIIIQPSFGVAIITSIGFLGILLAANFEKKRILLGIIGIIALIPLIWLLLAPYQKLRIITFLNPTKDPYGAGYNSLQSMISVGSGKIFGRGLGKGVQTQLAFLPERHTDFIFASIAEEMGLVGATLLLAGGFFILSRLVQIIENSGSFAGRAYVSGFFLAMLAQIVIHAGMNMGLLPITGVPFPLVSGGGSSLLATMIGLSVAQAAKKQV